MTEKSINDLVKEARSRIGAMRISPPAGLESSRAAADEFERAIDALMAGLPVGEPVYFYETIAKVEERFRPAYDAEVVGNAKTDAQLKNLEPISTGWWIVLARAGIAIRTGSTRPAFEAGENVILPLLRAPKQPSIEKASK